MCAMCVHTSEPDESEYEFLNDLFYSNLKEVMQPVRTDVCSAMKTKVMMMS